MGTSQSRQNNIEGPARMINCCLKRHGEQINVIKTTVKTQRAHIKLLCLDVNELARIYDTSDSLKQINVTEIESIREFSGKWQRHTQDLLSSVQTSLQQQCQLLDSSFKFLNEQAVDIFKKFDIVLNEFKQNEEQRGISNRADDSVEYDADDNVDNIAGDNVEKLKDRIENLEEQNKRLQHDNNEKSIKLKDYENEKESLENIIKVLKTEKAEFERQAKDIKENRPVSIQVYYQVKGEMVSNIIDELRKMLVKQLNVERRKLQFIVCQNKDDVNPELPLFVLCINASRLGADVSSILQDLNVSSNVSVLIFHHKDIHALPNQSSELVLTGPVFKDLGGIFDIAFLSEKGIYDCTMNQEAAVGIETFLTETLIGKDVRYSQTLKSNHSCDLVCP